MWTAHSLPAGAARASAAAPAVPAGPRPPSPRPHASRKPLAMSVGIALYAAGLVFWWLCVRDGASLGRLQLLVGRADDSADARASGPASALASALASTPGGLVDPQSVRIPRYECLGWRQTGDCSPDGPREPEHDRPCGTLIAGGVSGYCALRDTQTGEEVRALRANCSTVRGDVKFKCGQIADLAKLPHELDRAVAQAKWDAAAASADAPTAPHPQLRTPADAPPAADADPAPVDGIVMVVYPKLLVSVHAAVRLLRSLGCALPVELWYLESELGRSPASRPVLRSLLADYGPLTLERIADGRVLGFASKVWAVAHSRFDRLLFLDADNVPVRDPSFLFSDSAAFTATGAVFWPDFWHPRHTIFNIHAQSPLWEFLGTPFVDMMEQESGQLLLDRRRAQRSGALAALELLAYRSPNHLANLRFLHGDKDLFRLAWLKAGAPFHMVRHPPAAAGFVKNPRFRGGQFCGMTMAQFDPDAAPDAGADALLFLHRNAKKLTGTEDADKDRLWTHLQQFVFPQDADVAADAYRFISEHFNVAISGSATKLARTSMCYGGDKEHFALEELDALPWHVRELEDSLLAFAREAARLGAEYVRPSPEADGSA